MFPALLCALLTSIFASYLYYWFGITCLLLLLCCSLPEKFTWSYLSITTAAFASVVIVNLVFIDTAFMPEDFYYIAFFIISFIVFNQLALNQIIYLYRLLVTIFIVLAIWALGQYFTGEFHIIGAGSRPNTIFYTANTFSAAINLVLFPLIAINLNVRNKPLIFIIMLLLFYVLLLTKSRGGYLSFFIGFSLVFLLNFLSKRKHKLYWPKVLSGLTVVFVLFIAIDTVHRDAELDILASTRMSNISKNNPRLILYDVAWQRIKEKPLLGHGFNNFQYYWLKDQRAPFKNSNTKFVHNDYLQIWMETGVFGFIAILGVIFSFYYCVWKRYETSSSETTPVLLGLTGGLSAYFAHAHVDFVMYPCFLSLIFAAYLATANRIRTSANEGQLQTGTLAFKKYLTKWNLGFWRVFICVLLIVFFSQAYLAELSFNRAEKYMMQGQIKQALPYYELARRFTPYNAHYYVKEGTYWRNIVIQNDEGDWAAQHANKLFSDGAKANPFDVKNVLSRAVLNRDYSRLLSSSVSNETILKWFSHVLFWQPRLIAGQVEHVRTLSKYQMNGKAKAMLNKYMEINPESDELVKLGKELAL